MRTTVTLDRDVERMLKDAMHRDRSSFKETLNGAIRAGLSAGSKRKAKTTFKIKARALGLRRGIDPAGLNHLAGEMEVDAFMELTRRLEKNDPARR